MNCSPFIDDVVMDQTPVDWLSDCVVNLSWKRMNQVFNFGNPKQSLSLNTINKCLDVEGVSFDQWKLRLKNVPPSNPLYALSSMFLAEKFPTRSLLKEVEMQNTLSQCVHPLPKITKDVVVKTIDYLKERKMIVDPSSLQRSGEGKQKNEVTVDDIVFW